MFDETICPLNGQRCKNACEWRGDDGICVAHHMVVALEAIADNMNKIVTGPDVTGWEEEVPN